MSEAYRRLREDLPEPGQDGSGRFQSDPRKVKAWVEALPRANALATQQELDHALSSLATQKLDGSQRLNVMEELRGAVLESITLLEPQYSGSPLPLPAAKAQLAQRAELFHLWLAHGYRKAAVEICAPAGNVPMLRGNAVAQALARSAWHYSRALALDWRIYRAPATGSWQGLHRVHRFALQLKLDGKAVDDAQAGGQVEIKALYIQTLLMAVANPLAFSQSEQDSLWPIARAYASRCALLHEAPESNAPVVPEDADRGPGPGAAGESHSLWLDLRSYIHDVDTALSRQNDGHGELVPGRLPGFRVSVDVLTRLQRAFGLSAARSFKRLEAGHKIDTVIGLTSVHFFLAGQRDFDTFMRQSAHNTVHVVEDRATWMQVNVDHARAPRVPATVLDQSLGGYRMAWENASQVRARVGELVGLALSDLDDEAEWMIGVVRWLRYEVSGGLSAGVELLTRRSNAVGLRMYNRDGSPRAPVRAVEIFDLDGRGDHSFIMQGQPDAEATRIDVVRGLEVYSIEPPSSGEEMIAGVDVLVNAGDYTVLRPLRGDLVQNTDEAA